MVVGVTVGVFGGDGFTVGGVDDGGGDGGVGDGGGGGGGVVFKIRRFLLYLFQ